MAFSVALDTLGLGTFKKLANPFMAVSGCKAKSSMKNSRTRSGLAASAIAHDQMVHRDLPSQPTSSGFSSISWSNSTTVKSARNLSHFSPFETRRPASKSFIKVYLGSATNTAICGPSEPCDVNDPASDGLLDDPDRKDPNELDDPELSDATSSSVEVPEPIDEHDRGKHDRFALLAGKAQGGAFVVSVLRSCHESMASM
mmetsp:Transcript_28249/g.65579  ORF Transcript_28249/g.65579 Transcript_28249/m.65579 type:complete len:200 (-) Transcript_28249:484-1083(-)